MYSGWIRANTVLYIALIVFIVCVKIIQTKHYNDIEKATELLKKDLINQPRRNEVSGLEAGIYTFKVTNLSRYGKWKSYGYNQVLLERGVLSFDIEADFRSLFQINTKQLFVYVVVEYDMPDHPLVRNVVHDIIITEKDQALISLKDKEAEYTVEGDNIKGRNLNVKLCWELFPIIGAIHTHCGGKFPYKLPDAFQEGWY